MLEGTTDTIAALATPVGVGPIAIIRCSGPRVRAVIEAVFVDRSGKPRTLADHRVHTGLIRDPQSGEALDEVLVIAMNAPRSFTREDVCEVQGHGGIVQARRVLALLCRMGMRLARPGEFTRRAVLNGRIGLTEAEAIDDLIHAPGEEAARVAMDQLHGSLRTEVRELRREVVDLLAVVEASIDFPEEDVELVDRPTLLARAQAITARMSALASTYERGRVLRAGVRTLLAGRPNVGKSSLFNALLQCERAIVTQYPGTTRDVLEEGLVHRGVLLTLIDSAGLRESREPVEAIGVARSRALLVSADLVLYLVDGTCPVADEDRDALTGLARDRTIVVRTKIDLAVDPGSTTAWPADFTALGVSALTGQGIDGLLDEIHARVLRTLAPRGRGEGPVLTRERHKQGLDLAAGDLERFQASIRNGIPLDVACVDLYDASRDLGAIIGEVLTEDVLDRLFEKFCIGK